MLILGGIVVKITNENVGANYIINTDTVFIPKETITISSNKLEKILKRGIDIVGGLVGCILLIPLTFIIYLFNLTKNDKGPIFYTQKRIGKDGKVFTMYKYRSMVVNADKKLAKYLRENEEARKEYEKYKKLKEDPRITKVGNFIRRTSIDEFPQFINILKGEMSLVGPRPYLRREKKDMGRYYDYIIKCKPGLTGFWQINGRNDVTFQDRLEMDMAYIKQSNLKLDMKLLIKTVIKTIKKEGAI